MRSIHDAGPVAATTGLPRWELRGVGQLDPQLVGGAAATHEYPEGTIVIGCWAQHELTDLIRVLTASGFELWSVRRLGARQWARSA